MFVSSCAANTKQWFEVRVQVPVRSHRLQPRVVVLFSPHCSDSSSVFLRYCPFMVVSWDHPSLRPGRGDCSAAAVCPGTKCSSVSGEGGRILAGTLRALAARNRNDPSASQERKVLKEEKKKKKTKVKVQLSSRSAPHHGAASRKCHLFFVIFLVGGEQVKNINPPVVTVSIFCIYLMKKNDEKCTSVAPQSSLDWSRRMVTAKKKHAATSCCLSRRGTQNRPGAA